MARRAPFSAESPRAASCPLRGSTSPILMVTGDVVVPCAGVAVAVWVGEGVADGDGETVPVALDDVVAVGVAVPMAIPRLVRNVPSSPTVLPLASVKNPIMAPALLMPL